MHFKIGALCCAQALNGDILPQDPQTDGIGPDNNPARYHPDHDTYMDRKQTRPN